MEIADNALDEPDETFFVRLSAPTGGAKLGVPVSAPVTITDDDDPPTVQFSAEASSGAESTTSAVIDVNLSAPSARTVTVKYATANGTAVSGSDYAARAGVLTFAPGVTSLKVAVPIVNDALEENPADESFTVTLSSPINATLLGGTQVHTYTIFDEDLYGAIKLSSIAYSVNEVGDTKATITVVRVGSGNYEVDVNYATANGTATAGSDYEATAGTLTWPNGVKAKQDLHGEDLARYVG